MGQILFIIETYNLLLTYSNLLFFLSQSVSVGVVVCPLYVSGFHQPFLCCVVCAVHVVYWVEVHVFLSLLQVYSQVFFEIHSHLKKLLLVSSSESNKSSLIQFKHVKEISAPCFFPIGKRGKGDFEVFK